MSYLCNIKHIYYRKVIRKVVDLDLYIMEYVSQMTTDMFSSS